MGGALGQGRGFALIGRGYGKAKPIGGGGQSVGAGLQAVGAGRGAALQCMEPPGTPPPDLISSSLPPQVVRALLAHP